MQREFGHWAWRFLQVAVEHSVKIETFPSSLLGLLLQFPGEGCTRLRVVGAITKNVASDDTGHLGKDGL